MALTLAAAIEAAQLLAVERLMRILTTSTSDREIRLAAQVILKFKPSPPAAQSASQPPATTPAPSPSQALKAPPPCRHEAPLTAEELTHLRRLLPHVRPERFTAKRTPSHWREVLATHATPPPLRQAG